MNMAMEQESYKVDSCVREFHIYKDCWVPTIYRGSLPISFNYDAFSTISFTMIVFLVDENETRPKQVFSSSPLTLKKLGIVTELTCFFV